MKFKNLIGRNQIADLAIGFNELDVDLQGSITLITEIADSRGVADGIATLDSNGKLLSSQIPSITLSDFLGVVASESAMLALTGQRGDWAVRSDLQKTMVLTGDDASVLANWHEIVTPNSATAEAVTLSSTLYVATNVKNALEEVMTDVKDLATNVGGKVSLTGITPYVELTGTIDGTNKTFTSPVPLAGGKVLAFIGGQVINPDDVSVTGNDVTFDVSPDHEYQRPALMVMKAA
jgi:hypothetical protein